MGEHASQVQSTLRERLAASFPHVSYHGVTLPLSPPRADGDLPDGWRDVVETAVGYIVERVRETRSTDG